MDIIAVGSAMQDLALTPIAKDIFDGEFHNYKFWEVSSGGDAMNVAAACARIGVDVGCVCKVGDDLFGRSIRQIGEEDHVDMSGTVVSPKGRSTLSVHLLDGKGGRHSAFNLDPDVLLTEEDLDYEYLKSAKIVHYGSIHLCPALDGRGVATMFEKLHKLGVETSIDVSGTMDLMGGTETGYEKIKDALTHTDYFLPSWDEATDISGKDSCEEIVEFFRPYGMKMMLIKMGPQGVFVSDFEKSRMIPTFPVELAIDTIGCGDSFCAGFLSGISWGWSIWEAAVFGNAVGSMNCQVVGATRGVRPKAEVLAYIQKHIDAVPEDLRARFT
ncbi:carbohydrate kinase family protein [Zongyangia hominis]|uniref:Carbohydrate kinase family protein n=1 Tax=Zongyangia hominis TaxID=2763677 RepID=A0A926EAV4_9FIRM|nr:carbohydrate kinase family protein [Zongyangia hominis]MBC8570403.1 carbohydrate kinase family protein [Zongyangia hominis]